MVTKTATRARAKPSPQRQQRVAVKIQESEALVKEAVEALERELVTLDSEANWTEFLRKQAQFYAYSPLNMWLILRQRPNATRVASYTRWTQLGHQVKKGEHGMKIRVPIVGRKKEEGDEEQGRVRFFGIGTVFDVSQVEHDPESTKPDLTTAPTLRDIAPKDAEGEEFGHLRDVLLPVAGRINVRVMEAGRLSSEGSLGDYNSTAKLIRILSTSSPNQKVATLAHELSHAVHDMVDLHYRDANPPEPFRSGERKPYVETIAESAAFITCYRLGYDTRLYSFPYIAGWGAEPGKIKGALEMTQRVVKKLAELIEPSTEEA